MQHERRRDTLFVSLTGELDHCSAQSIRRELDQLIADPDIKQVVMNLKDMTFMDSSGIGVLLGRYRTLAKRGGKMAVQNMNPHVERIFYLSGLNQVIQIL